MLRKLLEPALRIIQTTYPAVICLAALGLMWANAMSSRNDAPPMGPRAEQTVNSNLTGIEAVELL